MIIIKYTHYTEGPGGSEDVE